MPGGMTKDTDLHFPSVTIVTASAGAGKTYALTHRYVQILLSTKIPHNALQNILAITFTNNAASEMKQRILKILKLAALGEEKTLSDLQQIITGDRVDLQQRARRLVGHILDNYSDFQVRTIDSFMSTVFKSSSLEFGFHPDFEISLSTDWMFDEGLELFMRDVREHSPKGDVVGKILDLVSENRKGDDPFLWNPYRDFARQVKKIYTLIASQTKPLGTMHTPADLAEPKREISSQAHVVEALIGQSTLTMNSHFARDLELIRKGNIEALLARKLRGSPVLKPKGKAETATHEQWIQRLEVEHGKLNNLLQEYILSYSESYFQPYIELYGLLQETIEQLKRRYGTIFIDDVNKTLAGTLRLEAVPEIYFKLGDTIFHYLVDEFQDTSQIQWQNLFPLVEESLSKGGSLFAVGDTKQSIYGFRDADWRIMKRLAEENVFPSARHEVTALEINYRSQEKILDFSREVFHTIIPGEGYETQSVASGLSTFEQHATPEHTGKGHVEVSLIAEEAQSAGDEARLLEIVEQCHARGFRYREIAILTADNKHVTRISGWLNTRGMPLISHSTLDVRHRKSAAEFVALLRFLDSPVDDLSFATFILGDTFAAQSGTSRDELARFIIDEREKSRGPLYTAFRDRYEQIWNEYFEHLLNVVGYYPLYDLLSEAYKVFRVFETSPGEEASFVKLLEVVEIFEREGTNTVKDFLEYSSDTANDEPWKIDVPKDIDALQVMTIHKAKGMEFPVVIVLLYDSSRRGSSYVLAENEQFVRLLKVTQAMGENVEELGILLKNEEFREEVDALNKLYVAFTRAEKEMYIVGVYNKERKEPTTFLPASGYEESDKPAIVPSPILSQPVFKPYHHSKRRDLRVQAYEGLGTEEAKRGDVIHRVLSRIEFVNEDFAAQISSVARDVCREMAYSPSADELSAAVMRFLAKQEFREHFRRMDGRTILCEQEIASGIGALYRADRIVIDNAEARIIDFKTGGDENEPEYIEQVKNYMKLLNDIYPEKSVKGTLAYIDLLKMRNVP